MPFLLAVLLIVLYRSQSSIRIYENGMECWGTLTYSVRFLWPKIVAFRLPWYLLGAQRIVLIEQSTKREVSILMSIFQSEAFQREMGRRVDMHTLIRLGLP